MMPTHIFSLPSFLFSSKIVCGLPVNRLVACELRSPPTIFERAQKHEKIVKQFFVSQKYKVFLRIYHIPKLDSGIRPLVICQEWNIPEHVKNL